jgi:hypothetical protein
VNKPCPEQIYLWYLNLSFFLSIIAVMDGSNGVGFGYIAKNNPRIRLGLPIMQKELSVIT